MPDGTHAARVPAPGEATPPPGSASLRGRPILLATDASRPARAAARVTAALAAARGARPQVVSAYDTSGLPIPPPLPALLSAADALIGADARAQDVEAVHADLARTIGHAVDWPVHVGLGTPASVVARVSTELGAALVVLGLRRHGALDRVLHDETTLDVMRGAPCPVLGVTSSLDALPRCVVVGLDAGPDAPRVAQLALELLADDGILVLAHAESPGRGSAAGAPAGDRVGDTPGLEAAFAQLEATLVVPAGVQLRRARTVVTSARHVPEGLLGVAARHGADAIVVGSRRHDWLDRALLGSVAAALVRDGRFSVLVVPPVPPRSPGGDGVKSRRAVG